MLYTESGTLCVCVCVCVCVRVCVRVCEEEQGDLRHIQVIENDDGRSSLLEK